VPESEHAITTFLYVRDHILVHYLEKAHSRVKIFDLDGRFVRDLPLPDYSSLLDWTGDWRRTDVFVLTESFLSPPAIFHHDVATGAMTPFMAIDAPIDTEPYTVDQVWYPSRDGTPISMFIMHPKDIVMDGTNPTLLTGYGGFASATTPGFARNRFLWLESGGVFAAPNLRGGNEYGEEWHRDGMLENKQNSFDDFITAAEWLITEGYTSPERLAVWGGSNGGLLVGAFVTQEPELARAAISDVPLLDMVRFHRLYGARIWTPEYGTPEDPEQFEWLYDYSPYHRVEDGAAYPAVLLTTAESDSRVHPSHAMKMAALLQDSSSSDLPVLLRFERQAGHGSGTPMSMVLDQYTDYYSFLFRELELRYDGREEPAPDWRGK
jgi:prolyl oligopeptidase